MVAWLQPAPDKMKQRPEAESSHPIPLNPIALLVKSCKETSSHVGLTSGPNPAPLPTWCRSHEMNNYLRRDQPFGFDEL